jgi:hypothetical protein
MPDYPIIDAHIHTYRTAAVGQRAQQGTGRSGHAGTVDEYLDLMATRDAAAIETAVMVNMTPVAEMGGALVSRGSTEEEASAQAIERLRRRNAWTCEVARQHRQLGPYISLDPSMAEEGALEELQTRLREGARGIKLHPANQRYFPADRRLWPVYEEAQRVGLPIISHSGLHFDKRLPAYASPSAFREVLEQFPGLTLVLAHLGQGFLDDSFEMAGRYPGLYFDCSFVVEGSADPPVISDEEAVAIFRRLGVERVLFGSDWPWGHPLRDADRVRRLALTEDEKRLILRENARRVLRL